MVGLDGIYDHFPLCHYEYGNSHRPHPLYSVLTIHRLTEETSSLSALWAHGRPHTRSHWPLLWPTAEFSRNSACPHKQNGSSHRKLVVFVVSAMSHYGPKPSWILLWASASNPDWDTAQAHNEWPSGKSWHTETKWGFHLGWFQTSRSLTALLLVSRIAWRNRDFWVTPRSPLDLFLFLFPHSCSCAPLPTFTQNSRSVPCLGIENTNA